MLYGGEDIALVDARLQALHEQWTLGEENAATQLARAREAWQQMKRANASEDTVAFTMAAQALDEAMRAAPIDIDALREEIRREQLVKRRLIETELRRVVVQRDFISITDALALTSAVVEAVNRSVTSKDEITLVQREFQRLTTRSTIDAEVIESEPDDPPE